MDKDAEIEELRRQVDALSRDNRNKNRELREVNREKEEAKRLIRSTTLTEYLDALHRNVFAEFSVQTNRKLTTKGTITDPKHKRCPTQLLPWKDFAVGQKVVLHDIHTNYPTSLRAFASLIHLNETGQEWTSKLIGSERLLEFFQKQAVEGPVARILEHLVSCDELNKMYALSKVLFENHYNPLSDNAEEPLARMKSYAAAAQVDLPLLDHPRSTQLRADQICVYQVGKEDDERQLAYVVEYKAPHKLTLPHLRLGVRDMNILQDVVNRATIPTDGDELFQYHADLFCAAAITQTFDYMIEGGVDYGILTTGEAYVFLKVDWRDPTTLYYHLAEPKGEFDADAELNCSAVSQVLAFTLMALGAPGPTQEQRNRAIELVQEWRTDFQMILANIPESVRKQEPPQSAYKCRTYPKTDLMKIDRSPYRTRAATRKLSCAPSLPSAIKWEEDDSETDDDPPDDTPIKSKKKQDPHSQRGGTARRGTSSNSRRADHNLKTNSGSGQSDNRHHQYCTQKCLLGLVHGGPLDESCPNVSFHRLRFSQQPERHPVDHKGFLMLLRNQLTTSLDQDVQSLYIQGARGALFKVRLSTYGYVFVAKGTVAVFVEDLQHEEAVYGRLQHLQGVCVPVFLGALPLATPYYYDIGVRIRHMTFLSYAGTCVDENLGIPTQHTVVQELARSLRAVHAAGVLQEDVRAPNALWNSDLGRVFVIDFERAVIVPDQYLFLLQDPSPSNPRKRRFEHEKANTDMLTYTRKMRAELSHATMVFN